MRKSALIFFALTVLFLGSACSLTRPVTTAAPTGKQTLKVVATIAPLGDIARQIGGNRAEILILLPPGSSPHSFEPSPEQIKALARADLRLQIGAGLDDWVGRLTAGSNKKTKTLILTQGLNLLHEDDGHEKNKHSPEDNSHIWLDPLIVRDHMATKVKEALSNLAPQDEIYFSANLKKFQEELTRLDENIQQSLSLSGQKNFIAFHPAWSYFAARYGLKEIAVMQAIPGQEPSPRQLANLVKLAKAADNPPILLEPQFEPKAGQLLAAEYNGRVYTLDPLGSPDTSYLHLMSVNLKIWEKALGVKAGGKNE
jgi:zinc transport system substrate-binding protein